MAKIKSFTSLEQSKKLAEILPLESADMYYAGHRSIINPKEWEYGDTPKIRGKYISFDDKRIFYPCWSLAALLEVLPEYNLQRTDWGNKTEYKIVVTVNDNNYASKNYDNPLDACVELILKLHELKML